MCTNESKFEKGVGWAVNSHLFKDYRFFPKFTAKLSAIFETVCTVVKCGWPGRWFIVYWRGVIKYGCGDQLLFGARSRQGDWKWAGGSAGQSGVPACSIPPSSSSALPRLRGWAPRCMESKVEGGSSHHSFVTSLINCNHSLFPLMSPTAEAALCRIRIGHTYLTHKYLLERETIPYCEDCLVPQTV